MNFPADFDPTRCILFLGSGFSADAKNKRYKGPPVGNGLRDAILSELELPSDETTDLKDVANYAVNRGVDLHKLLQELYIITAINSDQEAILEKKWRRIYTTNYDDIVEFFDKKSHRHPPRKTFSLEDSRPTKLPPNSIIHLHGYIHSATRKDVLSQLVLDHRSYSAQAALISPWWDQFERDLRGAQWVFFVGYNLNDFAVSKYLTKDITLSKITRFILRPSVNDMVAARLEGYGTIDKIEVSGFAAACVSAKSGAPIQELRQLRAFSVMDPYKDNKSISRPTPLEIEYFLTRGNYSSHALSSTYPKNEFAIPRDEDIESAIAKLHDARTLLIHSKTANGKSVFAEMLSLSLTAKGATCVRYKSHASIPPQEIIFLSELSDLFIFIQTYDDAVAISDQLKEFGTSVKFVIEINTGTDQVRRIEVQRALVKPIDRLDLNQLSKQDVTNFTNLLDRAGLPVAGIYALRQHNAELRDILLDLLNSQHVRDRLKVAVRPLVEDQETLKVVATACVLKAFAIHAGTDFIRAVTGSDPYDVMFKNELATTELGDIGPDQLTFHSAVFCEFFLREYVDGTGILSVICRLAFEAARRKNDGDYSNSQRSREARQALGSLVKYTNINSLFQGITDSERYVSKIFEELRDNRHINDEPLFWLQYSIYMLDISNFSIARKHIETAYLRAKLSKGFRTFQLDTYYLKLILQAPRGEEGFPGDTDVIFDLLDKVRLMVVSDGHRIHALRVLEDLKVFVANHGSILSKGERLRLSIQCMGIAADLDNFKTEVKTEFGTEKTKLLVQKAVTILAEID